MDGVEVSKRLRDLRTSYHIEHNMEKQLSTKKLAEMLNEKCKEKGFKGITEQTLKDYERPGLCGTTENITKGKAVYGMRVEYLDLLADFYGVSTDYILCRSNKKTPDVNLQAACAFTGLSELSAALLHEESRHNLMYWRIDMVNFLLEHQKFKRLIDLIIGYANASTKRMNGFTNAIDTDPLVTEKDVFKAKVDELFNSIVPDFYGVFRDRLDRRAEYQLYHSAYLFKKSKKKEITLDEVKKEMEEKNLIFKDDMFQDTDKPRFIPCEGSDE